MAHTSGSDRIKLLEAIRVLATDRARGFSRLDFAVLGYRAYTVVHRLVSAGTIYIQRVAAIIPNM